MFWRPRRRVSTFTNWAGNQICRPLAIHTPTSEQEVAAIVAEAQAQRVPVKVVGSGHSWSDAACTTGRMISLDRMNRVLHVDREVGWVTVEGGIRIQQLNESLAREGLALGNLGSMGQQTIAGAVSTGTHGTGIRFGSLSSFVRGVRLVRADGEVIDIDHADSDLFEAARLSVGSLGVLTQIKLQCEPAFDLEQTAYCLKFDDALEQMQFLVDQHHHVRFWWLPHTNTVLVVTMRRVPLRDKRRRRVPNVFGDAIRVLVNRGVFDGPLRLGALSPAWVPAINALVARTCFRLGRTVDRSDHVFRLPMPPRHREMEYGIPRDVAPLALRRLRDLVTNLRIAADFVVEVRFVARDSILLSPSFRRDSCQLGAHMGNHPHLSMYFDAFERLCHQLDGRPHWGKEFHLSAEVLRQRVPGIKRFLEVRRSLDPKKQFDNTFTRRVFGD